MIERAPSVVRRPLSREVVLAAALDLVDREGLEALSMRKLGAELGVEAMSLYNHIPSKSALLDGLIERVVGELEPPDPGKDWTEQAREMARSYRKMAMSHPHVVALIATRPFNTIAALDPLERALRLLRSAGFDQPSALHAFRTVVSFATGYTLAETEGFFGEHVPTDADEVLQPKDLDQDRFPYLIELLPTIAACDHDEEFEFALDVIIQGLTAKIPR